MSIVCLPPLFENSGFAFSFGELSAKRQHDLEMLYYLAKESISKGNNSSLDEYYVQQQQVNKFTIGQILITDAVLDTVRRTLRKMSPGLKVSNEELHKLIIEEVLKREVLDDEKAADAKKKVTKALKAVSTSKSTATDAPARDE